MDDPDDFYDALKFNEYKSKIQHKWKHLYQTNKPHELKHKVHKYTTPYAQLDDLAFKEKLKEFTVDNVFKTDMINTPEDGLGSHVCYAFNALHKFFGGIGWKSLRSNTGNIIWVTRRDISAC
jgi:hypothetical protein